MLCAQVKREPTTLDRFDAFAVALLALDAHQLLGLSANPTNPSGLNPSGVDKTASTIP
jgi:hypothetical protein